MDELDQDLDDLAFEKSARIRGLMDELREPEADARLSWRQLLDSVRWEAGASTTGLEGRG